VSIIANLGSLVYRISARNRDFKRKMREKETARMQQEVEYLKNEVQEKIASTDLVQAKTRLINAQARELELKNEKEEKNGKR